MQSRKKLNQEIERNKRQKRRISTGIGVLVLLAICAGIAWFAIGVHQRSWIMTFEGQRIPTNELRFVMQQNSMWVAPEQLTEVSMSDLTQSLTIMHHADRLGLGMTDEERDSSLEWIQSGGVIPNTREAEFRNINNMRTRLVDHHVPEFTLDPAEYQEEI